MRVTAIITIQSANKLKGFHSDKFTFLIARTIVCSNIPMAPCPIEYRSVLRTTNRTTITSLCGVASHQKPNKERQNSSGTKLCRDIGMILELPKPEFWKRGPR